MIETRKGEGNVPEKLPQLRGDVMEELRELSLPLKTALATYLKNSYGHLLKGMTDENWITEAGDLLWALRLAEKPKPPQHETCQPDSSAN